MIRTGYTCLALFSFLAMPAIAIAADRPEKELPLPGEVFNVEGRVAFLIPPGKPVSGSSVPWVWYAPTLPGLPSDAEKWMFHRFGEAGIAVAGIDVGESAGNPEGRRLYGTLYNDLTKNRGFSRKPVLLARSRGGLMLINWAAENADKVGGIAGIYPVCNLTSYPGIEKAAPAYGMTPAELTAKLAEHNPVSRLKPLVDASVPFFAIHGDNDAVVPLELNSGEVARRYKELGGQAELVVPPGQGHNMWVGFFECRQLMDFVLKHAK
jgi:pimeloyl-ACP methyl ester carboxylesterase